jgi:hemin uptake protein HemP
VVHRYLDCGDLHCGFARVRCDHCGHEYLLALTRRSYYTSFCP